MLFGNPKMSHVAVGVCLACDDDFVFPRRESVRSSESCQSCGNSNEVIAVDDEMAGMIARFLASHG